MKFPLPPSTALVAALFSFSAHAQTYTKCNPTEQSCPADPALGGTSQVNFASGANSQYTPTGNTVSYNSDGAQLSVAASGNNPTLTSSFYLMFGHVDFVMKTAPGVGMVSAAILISDDLDEIDWEVLGYEATTAQTNYFSKGVAGSYNHGGSATVPTSQTAFNTYSIDWTADQVTWLVNGVTVRTLPYSSSGGAYPQSPMQIKLGAWAGGDSTNAPGTIQWAGGPINYADGPFVMQVQSVNAIDYSTGTEYQYNGMSGTWQSIVAVGGSVGTGPSGQSDPSSVSSTPTTTTSFGGTHQQTSSYVTPSVYPWIPASSGQATSTAGPPASSYLSSLGYDTTSTSLSSTQSSAQSSTASSTQHSSTTITQEQTTMTTMASSVSSLGSSSIVKTSATVVILSSTVQTTTPAATTSATNLNFNAAGRSAADSALTIFMTACFTGILAFLL